MIAVRRSSPLAILAALVASAALALTFGAQGAAAASKYRTCSLSERDQDPPGSKPTYNLTLKRSGTSCATAKRVMRGFHRCRSRTAVNCSKRLLSRWRCSARKTSSTDTIFYARYTCKWGTRRVQGTYQQNT